MLLSGQYLGQKQTMQQRLSPQQIQYIKLLQLHTTAIETRIKEEIEQNPILEDLSEPDNSYPEDPNSADSALSSGGDTAETNPVDANTQIDWDSILHNPDFEGKQYGQKTSDTDWRDLPKPYINTGLENLEEQVSLINLSDDERLIAEEIIGSLDNDGYLNRDIQAIVDSIVFSTGRMIFPEDAEKVLHLIQRLDPPGIASRNLRECLITQLEMKPSGLAGRNDALRILQHEWDSFSMKHFDKIAKRLNLSDENLKKAYECILALDPKPGKSDSGHHSSDYIIPDFEVIYSPEAEAKNKEAFQIILNRRNSPPLRISPSYKHMWDQLQKKSGNDGETRKTKDFIKERMESAKAFMDIIQQRSNTLINIMKTIVDIQHVFFRTGSTIKPMIRKDVADIVKMDISTISRVVNGKYVQTRFGVYELRYFFTEGIETQDGETASNRDVKNYIQVLVQNEPAHKPLTDDNLVALLKEKGYVVARRTVSKYREQLGIPVARLRKSI